MFRFAIAIVFTIIVGATANAQPCNPVIDGTYCGSQTYYGTNEAMGSNATISSKGLGASISSSEPYDDPGTFGAITFSSDGTRCIGLLFRSKCNER